jgi:hypothetical protein
VRRDFCFTLRVSYGFPVKPELVLLRKHAPETAETQQLQHATSYARDDFKYPTSLTVRFDKSRAEDTKVGNKWFFTYKRKDRLLLMA